MSVNDLRGVQYGTFTGTDIKALMEQAKESSSMPRGLYVALIRNAAGQLVEWKTFVK